MLGAAYIIRSPITGTPYSRSREFFIKLIIEFKFLDIIYAFDKQVADDRSNTETSSSRNNEKFLKIITEFRFVNLDDVFDLERQL